MSALSNTRARSLRTRAHSLTPSGNLRRRQLRQPGVRRARRSRAAALAVAVLFILVYYAAKHGASQ